MLKQNFIGALFILSGLISEFANIFDQFSKLLIVIGIIILIRHYFKIQLKKLNKAFRY